MPSVSSRRTCTTRSGCVARTPCLTVAPNSADRVIRYCAGSTVGHYQAGVRQSATGVPCDAARRRSRAPRGCASAAGNRAHAHDADCSAGRSACPWPRLSLLIASGCCCRPRATAAAVGKLCVLLVPARASSIPGNVGFAAVSPTFGRLFEGTDVRSLGQTCAGSSQVTARGLSHNVAERLALRDKTVSFWQCLSHRDGPQTTKQGCPVVQRA